MQVLDEYGREIDPKRLSFIDGQLALDGEPLEKASPFWRNYVCQYRPADETADARRQLVADFNSATPKMSNEEMAEAAARMREVLGLPAEPAIVPAAEPPRS